MAAVLTRIYQLGYRGLVELEHAWTKPGLDAERRALDWLRRADAALASVQTREEPVPAERQGGEGGRDRAADVAISGPPIGKKQRMSSARLKKSATPIDNAIVSNYLPRKITREVRARHAHARGK